MKNGVRGLIDVEKLLENCSGHDFRVEKVREGADKVIRGLAPDATPYLWTVVQH